MGEARSSNNEPSREVGRRVASRRRVASVGYQLYDESMMIHARVAWRSNRIRVTK